jgi:hypothetical protein
MQNRTVTRIVWLVAAATAPARAGTIGLAWDPAAGASGYRVYYGLGPGSYTDSRDVGNATATTLTGLADCTNYYLAVKAYNAAGESQGFSNELSGWARPLVAGVLPDHEMQGGVRTVDIEGANFRDGAAVELDNPHVQIAAATVLDCNRIHLEIAVGPRAAGERPAQVGDFEIAVLNPDGTHGARADGFHVLADPARFDVNRSDASTRGRLDGKDTVWIARLFGAQETLDAVYDPDFDLDGNGWVDGADLAYVASHLGRCWSGEAWTFEACGPSGS